MCLCRCRFIRISGFGGIQCTIAQDLQSFKLELMSLFLRWRSMLPQNYMCRTPLEESISTGSAVSKLSPVSLLSMNFSAYATPHSSLKYSPDYFASLTFERAQSIDFPTIANPGLIVRWCFDTNEPASAPSTVILPGEVVPHAEDLVPISRAMEAAYATGSRSVVVDFGDSQVVYHFSKVCLPSCSIHSLQIYW